MKIWQIGAIGALAFILGCAGMGAYVPDGATGTGTPLQCAALAIYVQDPCTIDDVNLTNFDVTVTNGNVQDLQGRAPGDATYTISVSGNPNDVGTTITPQTNTVGLNSLFVHTLGLDGDGAELGTFELTLTVTEAGCTSVVRTVTVEVVGGNTGSLLNGNGEVKF
ncbi:MAG: hypothetical protein ACKVQS_06180 [Fimbriimonadaceae bacterium]